MKAVFHKILFVFAVLAFVGVAVLLSDTAKESRRAITCKGLAVNVESSRPFVSEEDVKSFITNYYGDFVGERIDSLNLDRIERVLNRQSAIKQSQAYTTSDGILHITIKEREPVVRFQSSSSFGFYADAEGYIFPLQKAYSPLVPVVTGAFPLRVGPGYKGEVSTPEEKQWLLGCIGLIEQIQGSRLWEGKVSEINIKEDGDFVLIFREGRERFIFGGAEDAAAKFGKIEKYYKYIKPSKPDNYYHTVNLKYKDQIICRQK